MVALVCNLSTKEVETGEPEVHLHSQLHRNESPAQLHETVSKNKAEAKESAQQLGKLAALPEFSS